MSGCMSVVSRSNLVNLYVVRRHALHTHLRLSAFVTEFVRALKCLVETGASWHSRLMSSHNALCEKLFLVPPLPPPPQRNVQSQRKFLRV